jgi:hypothetical protein
MSAATVEPESLEDLEPLSPELVLVTPSLREQAIRTLPAAASFVPPRAEPTQPRPHRRVLGGTVEVTARIPVVVAILLWSAVVVAKTMIWIGAPVVLTLVLVTLIMH